MSRRSLVGFAIAASAAIGGCALGGNTSDVPALIASADAASRTELQNAVNSALGKPATLSDDALTRTSTLTIERDAVRDASGRRIEVREREAPELFRLVKRGTQCVLIHERTRRESVLHSATCAAE